MINSIYYFLVSSFHLASRDCKVHSIHFALVVAVVGRQDRQRVVDNKPVVGSKLVGTQDKNIHRLHNKGVLPIH